MRRASRTAGARRVIRSSWSVKDDSTGKLMTAYHGDLWLGGLAKLEALRAAQLELLEQLHEHGIDADQIQSKIHQALGQQGVAQDLYKRALEQLHEHGIDVDQIQVKIHEALGRQGIRAQVLQRALEQQGAARELLKRAQNQLHEGGVDIQDVYRNLKRAQTQLHGDDVDIQDIYRKMKGLHESDVDVQSILKQVRETMEDLGVLHTDDNVKRMLPEVQRHQGSGDPEIQKRNAELKAQIEKLRGQEIKLNEELEALRWNRIQRVYKVPEANIQVMKQEAKALYERAKKDQPQTDDWRELSRTRKEQPQRTQDVMRRVLEALEEAGVDDELRVKVMQALAGRGKSV